MATSTTSYAHRCGNDDWAGTRWHWGRFFIALLLCLPCAAHADPLPIDYRCDGEISLSAGAPIDGWTPAPKGRLPGKAGNPCWVRVDVAQLAPRVLEVNGADGYKHVALFNTRGNPLAEARDFGERTHAIVGSGGVGGSMLFPTLQTANSPIYARVERDRYTIGFGSTDAMRLLKQMGYEADLAVNGIEAIAHIERERYDVVLMDVQMPEMDGLEASRQIVRRGTDRPRIVAMTANAMQGDRDARLAAGMDDYVTKPIRVDRLVQALNDTPIRVQDA